ncbi:MAG: O-antigen ligase domain-containing protein [Symplocastrum torsivum CPER-KK1]|jgi:hypothetical protein|uniref:O-antigen ligase domain-containing protein n=1 Tax=Symplocastrum torsivum CPER-KK1 TaxID=450513 RepID=A0A951PRI9_9CYAN|nr:O-antigen ligase domain-containing protein [Symplocastrum torsivum CPER-KK1]
MSSPQALLVTLCWIPAVLYIFMRFPPQRAVIVSFIVAWLYLPVVNIALPGIPDLSKMSATCYGVLLATLLFDAGRITSFKPGWLDLPMLIWCFCPFASSMANGLGAYDGFSAALDQTVTWGVPYFLGRIYLNNLAGVRQLAVGVFVGGLSYVPFCLIESRLSPQMHQWVYGYHASVDFTQAYRLGGYRPTVFMNHGLAVGAWMMAATLAGIWLWKTGTIKQLWDIPMNWLVITLLITFVLCRSTGAYALLVIGLVLIFLSNWLRTALPVLLVLLSMCIYLYINSMTETYFTDQLVTVMSKVFPEDRVSSAEFRFNNEEILADKARQSLVFGWGGYGRNRVYERNWAGELVDITVTDSLWIIAFGVNGIVGLSSLTASMLLPVASLFVLRYPASTWSHRKIAPVAVLALVLALYMLDCILNAMINPIFALTSGGISGLVLSDTATNQVTRKRSSVSRRSLAQQR